MGRKERREREQQELKRSIMDAAREIARAEGWRNVTMRRIAERIEYSHAAIYEYFTNKDVLLLELVREGFNLLRAEMQRSQSMAQNPEEALRLLGQGYLAFAERNPELYQLMNGLDGVTFGTTTAEEGQSIEDITVEVVKALFEARGWPLRDLSDKVNILWFTIHGLVTLTMANRIEGGKERIPRLFAHILHDTLLAWEYAARESVSSEAHHSPG